MQRRHHAQKLIVAGCMAQRFAKELPESMPEVDAFIGLDQLTQIVPIIEGLLEREEEAAPENFVTPQPRFIPDFDTPALPPDAGAHRLREDRRGLQPSLLLLHHPADARPASQPHHRLDRAGGAQPRRRGRARDQPHFAGHDLFRHGPLEEKAGPRAQVDSSRGDSLTALLRELQKIEGDFWIRLLYTHPAHWSDELIQTIAQCPKVARYVDMPLQHISDPMLEAMRRETSSQHIRDLIARIRAGVPGIALRTTFIAGFPGETEEDFDTLLEFIEETRFERLGVFKYSQEEGTRAAKRDGHLPARTKQARWKKAMAAQQRIALEQTAAAVGRPIRVLVEAPGMGRSEADAPDVDARVYVPEHLPVGQFADLHVTGARGYDLVAA